MSCKPFDSLIRFATKMNNAKVVSAYPLYKELSTIWRVPDGKQQDLVEDLVHILDKFRPWCACSLSRDSVGMVEGSFVVHLSRYADLKDVRLSESNAVLIMALPCITVDPRVLSKSVFFGGGYKARGCVVYKAQSPRSGHYTHVVIDQNRRTLANVRIIVFERIEITTVHSQQARIVARHNSCYRDAFLSLAFRLVSFHKFIQSCSANG